MQRDDSVRVTHPSLLRLPHTPNNLASMTRQQLLEQYDIIGDYWATWLQRASMLPETQDDYTDSQLRRVISLASGPYAQNGWQYYDHHKFPKEHEEFYEGFFKRWDEIIYGKKIAARKFRRTSHRRPARRIAKQKSRSKNRHTASQDIKRSRRPGPIKSAAESRVGTRARGNDGNMYVCKADKRGVHKWTKSKRKGL